MVPYSYNMVDMGGIDLAEANGTVVQGVYDKIVEAMNLCGDLILYNWKFAEIDIAPSAYTVLQQAHSILINGLIQVTELDQITVIGLPPPIVPVSPLVATENGLYEAEPPASGFNPVQVMVPERVPVIEPIEITEDGIYAAPEGVDGFSPITVNVSGEDKDWLYLDTYIQTSGFQWINTGYIVKDNTRFDVVYNASSSQPNYPTLFGVRDNDSGASAGRCTLFVKHVSYVNGSYAWGTNDISLGMPTHMYLSNKKQRCIFEKGSLSIYQDDGNALVFEFLSELSATNTQPIYMFTLNQGGVEFSAATRMTGKLYRFRIYEGETLVHEYLPWQENGVVCLKDSVTDTILYNSGTGDFVYGVDT